MFGLNFCTDKYNCSGYSLVSLKGRQDKEGLYISHVSISIVFEQIRKYALVHVNWLSSPRPRRLFFSKYLIADEENLIKC